MTDTPAQISMPGISLGLTRITALLHCLKNPHLTVPIIHIAGTNGKGSVSAYMSSILHASQLRVGRFNSPHLVDEWDCCQIAGQTVEPDKFSKVKIEVERINKDKAIKATAFEVLTATAFSLFSQTSPSLDLAIIEVGMGGETDATNVVPAERTLLSIITSIELDHQKFLGDTIQEIAAVKAGIIKPGVDVIFAKQAIPAVATVVRRIADQQHSRLWHAGVAQIIEHQKREREKSEEEPIHPEVLIDVNSTQEPPMSYPCEDCQTSLISSVKARLPLRGSYQLSNVSVAALAAVVLQSNKRIRSMVPKIDAITEYSIGQGVSSTEWAGRLDWVTIPNRGTKRVLVDGAHNPSSAQSLAAYGASLPLTLRPTTLIIGISAPRPPISILKPLLSNLASISKIVCTTFTEPSSMPWIKATSPGIIADAVKHLSSEMDVQTQSDLATALSQCSEKERILVAGSLYLAADVYRLIREQSISSS